MQSNDPLSIEWQAIQRETDHLERCSLFIKITSIIIFSFSTSELLWLVILLCWGLDCIWKTFQSRAVGRLLVIEKSIQQTLSNDQKPANSIIPMQFNQTFSEQPRSLTLLLQGYAKQALKPTVAFPYVVLLIAIIM